MNRSIKNLFTTLSLTAAMAFAQGPHGPGGPQSAQQANSGLNMAKQQTVTGAITSVQIAAGAQYPSIVVNKVQIKVAPVWYLLENDFELAVGQSVRITAAPSNTANDPYLYAIDITKTSGGAKIALRDSLGVPLWIGSARMGGNSQATGTSGDCVDPISIKTATGTIDSVNSGVGIQQPTLVFKVTGALLTIELGPERILAANDLEIKPGATITVKYAQSTGCDEFVALQITDASGHAVVLRHDDGTPAWMN